jgi:hypothetical protein
MSKVKTGVRKLKLNRRDGGERCLIINRGLCVNSSPELLGDCRRMRLHHVASQVRCDQTLVKHAIAGWNPVAKSHNIQIGRAGWNVHELKGMRRFFSTPGGWWMWDYEVPSHRRAVRAALGNTHAESSCGPALFDLAEAVHAG